jgi:hypothetical protein
MDNYKKEMRGEPHIHLNTCGSTMDFWKDELKKIE